MIRSCRKNLRGFGLLFSVLLLLMAMPSRGIWQCLDGSACQHDCPMPHLDGAIVHVSATPACSKCALPAIVKKSTTASAHAASCSSSRCELRFAKKSALVLHHAVEVVQDWVSPSPVELVFAVVMPARTSRLQFDAHLLYVPQRLPLSTTNRGPPTLL